MLGATSPTTTTTRTTTAAVVIPHDLAEHTEHGLLHGLVELALGVLQLGLEESLRLIGLGRGEVGRGRRRGAGVLGLLGQLLEEVQVEARVGLGLGHLGLAARDLRGDGLDQAEQRSWLQGR